MEKEIAKFSKELTVAHKLDCPHRGLQEILCHCQIEFSEHPESVSPKCVFDLLYSLRQKLCFELSQIEERSFVQYYSSVLQTALEINPQKTLSQCVKLLSVFPANWILPVEFVLFPKMKDHHLFKKLIGTFEPTSRVLGHFLMKITNAFGIQSVINFLELYRPSKFDCYLSSKKDISAIIPHFPKKIRKLKLKGHTDHSQIKDILRNCTSLVSLNLACDSKSLKYIVKKRLFLENLVLQIAEPTPHITQLNHLKSYA